MAVACCRLVKTYDSTTMKVLLRLREGYDDLTRLVNDFLKSQGAKLLLGQAPRGNLERRLQSWLDGGKGNGKGNGKSKAKSGNSSQTSGN